MALSPSQGCVDLAIRLRHPWGMFVGRNVTLYAYKIRRDVDIYIHTYKCIHTAFVSQFTLHFFLLHFYPSFSSERFPCVHLGYCTSVLWMMTTTGSFFWMMISSCATILPKEPGHKIYTQTSRDFSGKKKWASKSKSTIRRKTLQRAAEGYTLGGVWYRHRKKSGATLKRSPWQIWQKTTWSFIPERVSKTVPKWHPLSAPLFCYEQDILAISRQLIRHESTPLIGHAMRLAGRLNWSIVALTDPQVTQPRSSSTHHPQNRRTCPR